MNEDDRQKCSDCGEFLDDHEFVHKIEFGHWDVESNSYENGGSSDIYCNECWSEMKPRAEGTQYEPQSPDILKNTIEAANGDLSVDFGSLTIGARVFLTVIGEDWHRAVIKNRWVGERVVQAYSEYDKMDDEEVDEFLETMLVEGDLPPIVSLIPTDKSPFEEYPEYVESQSELSDF